RLLLVLLDVVAVGAPEDLPAEVPDIIARQVFAVPRELAAEAPARAPGRPRAEPLADGPRLQPEAPHPGEDRRIKITGQRFGQDRISRDRCSSRARESSAPSTKVRAAAASENATSENAGRCRLSQALRLARRRLRDDALDDIVRSHPFRLGAEVRENPMTEH